MKPLETLPNIGPKLSEQLETVGIRTAEALRDAGAEEAWLRIQRIDASACIHRLLALEGALRGVRKAELPTERKAALREFYRQHQL